MGKTMNAKRISSTIHKSNLPMISLNKDLGYQVSHVKCIKILIRIRIMLLIHVKIKRFNDVKEFYMKKLIISIMAIMLFLTGCGKSQEKATLEKDIDNLQKKIKN